MEDKTTWAKTLDKDRAAGVIVHDGKILMIHRIRKDKEYWVLPGGSVEENETTEEALNREMAEELGISVREKSFLFEVKDAGRSEHYFLITEYEGEPKIGGPELERMSEENQYILEEREIHKLSEINLLPKGIIMKLLDSLQGDK